MNTISTGGNFINLFDRASFAKVRDFSYKIQYMLPKFSR